MLSDAFRDCGDSFPITCRFDGKMFNHRRLQAESKVQTGVLVELLYADNMTKNASIEQDVTDRVSQVCDNYDLTNSTTKTEVVYQPVLGKPYSEPTITVHRQRLQAVDKFAYLGSIL